MRLLEQFEHPDGGGDVSRFPAETRCSSVCPTVYVRLPGKPQLGAHRREIGARMRLFVSGSSPLPKPEVLEEFRDKFRAHHSGARYDVTGTMMNLSSNTRGSGGREAWGRRCRGFPVSDRRDGRIASEGSKRVRGVLEA